jgi:uncharacterized protein YbjT (DUF2867 family)
MDGRDFLMSELPVLIIGGGGKTGARVNSLLTARGVATRPVSRSAAIPFGWARPETWQAALDGVSNDALGRPARDFSDDARTTAATGVWGA